MACPHCTAPVVAFAVPEPVREHAPADETAICTRCLRTAPASEADASPSSDPDFAAVDPAFPAGEGGAALALVCGDLESLALNRARIEALLDYATSAGVDVYLFLERLDASEAAFDIDRRREAVFDLL